VLGRLAVLGPVRPRRQVHQRLGEQGLRVEVVGVLRGELAHRVGVGSVELLALVVGVRRVAIRERRQVGLLARGDLLADPDRVRERLERALLQRRVHRQVDVGAERERHAPEAHRAVRVELRAASKARIASSWLNA
jgi:hypothetical protein